MLAENRLSGERFRNVKRAPPERVEPPGGALFPRWWDAVYGNVSFQLLIVPTSCAAWSWTFNFQVPLAGSEEALTV